MKTNKNIEEVLNLPALNEIDTFLQDDENDDIDISNYTHDELAAKLDEAKQVDAALPTVQGLDKVDSEYDDYAEKAMETFDELVELANAIDDKHLSEIYNAASSMMSNAINSTTNKAKKNLDMVKLQLQRDKLEHERQKLEYLKARHLKNGDDGNEVEAEGKIVTSRNDIMNQLREEIQNEKDKDK